jgi:hypothetical protein
MQSRRGKLFLLVALLLAWPLVFAYRRPAEPPLRPERPGVGARERRVPAAQGGGVPRLKLELLNLPRPPYPAESHNIFGSPPPPPSSRSGEAARVAVTVPPAPPPDPFQEEAKQLRYVGFLQADGTLTAFIVRGQEVHTLPVGGTIGGHFRVHEIQEEFLLLTSLTGDKQVRLPLAAQAGGTQRR